MKLAALNPKLWKLKPFRRVLDSLNSFLLLTRTFLGFKRLS